LLDRVTNRLLGSYYLLRLGCAAEVVVFRAWVIDAKRNWQERPHRFRRSIRPQKAAEWIEHSQLKKVLLRETPRCNPAA